MSTQDTTKTRGNRLLGEKSPYLQQHSLNPVDWRPWGDEAFEQAAREDKPVFLSIGYSTCHWCHVMAHESFEDGQVAALLNDSFIPVKVDREERPDVDALYMAACRVMTGRGGWPLTAFLTPDRKPYFAGTYFPRESGPRGVGMLELAPLMAHAWKERRAQVRKAADEIVALVGATGYRPAQAAPSWDVIDDAYRQFAEVFDEHYGGFGGAPKFPSPHNLLFLLRYGEMRGSTMAQAMVYRTLNAMRQGGIYDHVGFGFHRYSTDERWLAPHFEKMLHDQAMLALSYAEAFAHCGNETFGATAREVLTYVLRAMTSPEGAFYAAEDADSEGVEGRFYLWTAREIRALLPPEEAALIIARYHVEERGNFAGGEGGDNILYVDSLPDQAVLSPLALLYEARERRVHPHRDEKVLTDWNGLMIAAFARCGTILKEPQYLAAAARAADWLLRTMAGPDGRLLHRWRDGEGAVAGMLDDYAFLTWGLLELHDAMSDRRWLDAASRTASLMIDRFEDRTDGGFFSTPDDGDLLPARRKELVDGALPSGNSVALHNLFRLAALTHEKSFLEAARRAERAFAAPVSEMPSAYAWLLDAVMTAPAS